ncbi:response regulator [Stieleria sp. JC731]|uniref:hybrid sensor histidine kinase/response regulator n=1 Tax=Pirellulaceae TaxID=2691357 RepID=UPI001E495745|nr:hybrid sensor histidine kinase/response regulator [Stieleria sp. JC731]MCC9599534.1 response regulator [Stieleria sp. JC731]
MPQKILMIDDNPADANIVKRLLSSIEGSPYEFIHVENGEIGLAKLEESEVDCVVLDYQLGSASGIEILTQIRRRGIDTPVIAMTGEGSESVAVATLKSGAQDYLVKGQVSADTLHRSIVSATRTVSFERKLVEQREELLAFTGTVSHDLRTPLRHICQYMELLCAELPESNENCQFYSNAIKNAGQRMMTLIDNLLEYTKVGRSEKPLEKVDLNAVLSDVVDDLLTDVDRTHTSVELETLPAINGDSTALRQLFQNLIGNAIKYNQSPQKRVRVYADECDGQTTISVSDNGIGIAAEFHSEIFSPLRRLHTVDEYEGSGLGLATAERIAKQHRAQITLESTPGVGTTFHLAFPSID